MTAGIESVVGFRGPNAVRELISQFNDYYLKRFLQKSPITRADEIAEMYRKVSLKYALSSNKLYYINRSLIYSSILVLYEFIQYLSIDCTTGSSAQCSIVRMKTPRKLLLNCLLVFSNGSLQYIRTRTIHVSRHTGTSTYGQ